MAQIGGQGSVDHEEMIHSWFAVVSTDTFAIATYRATAISGQQATQTFKPFAQLHNTTAQKAMED
jgi:hypothetical protein